MEDDSSDVYVNKTDEQRFLYDLKLLCELALMLCGETDEFTPEFWEAVYNMMEK
jgi:hypothetical protein